MDRIEININESADLESQIVNQILINYAGLLDFALIYKRINVRNDKLTASGKYEYRLKASTIGQRDISFLELIQQLQRAYARDKHVGVRFERQGHALAVEKDFFNKKIAHSARIDCRYQKGSNPKGIDKRGRIKFFNFDQLALGGIRRGENILLLGFSTGGKEEARALKASLSELTAEIDAKCRTDLRHYSEIDRSLRETDRDKNTLTTQMVDSFKAVSGADPNNAIHLFRYNTYDNRLYYSFLDNAILDAENFDWQDYPDSAAGARIRLSENQITYVIENNFRKFVNDKEVRAEAIRVLRNIHDTTFLKKFLAANDDKKKWLLAWVISCIPQEPWTGVAGYTMQTRSIDFSQVKGESRWDPAMLNEAHYYSKLMVYERLIGVGGQGSMIAYPIMDCGQVAGVLFSNNRIPNLPEKEYLQKFLGLSHAFKNVISANRQLEFLQGTLDDLLQVQSHQVYPIVPILNNIPKLLNTPLVMIWESDGERVPERPLYIHGYQPVPNEGAEDDSGLMPMRFGEFAAGHPLYEMLSVNEFRHLENLGNGLATAEDVSRMLSPQFVADYQRRTIDGALQSPETGLDHKLAHSIAYNLGSAYVHRYKIKNKVGRIVIFFNEDHSDLEEHIESLKVKMNYIGLVINQTDALSYLASNKDLNLHHLRPINDNISHALDKALEGLKKLKANPKFASHEEQLKEISTRITQGQLFNENLKAKLGRMDNRSITAELQPAEDHNLLENLEQVWLMSTYPWERAVLGGNQILYREHARCVITLEHEHGIATHQIGQPCFDPKIKELTVFTPRLELLMIFENLFINAFHGAIITREMLLADPERAEIRIDIKPHSADFYEFRVIDRGKGMDPETRRWVEDIIDYAAVHEDNVHPRDLQVRYDKLKSGNDQSSKGSGYGIRLTASILQGLYKNYELEGQPKLTILKTGQDGTCMSFLMPKIEF